MKWFSRYFSVKRWIWKYVPEWLKKRIRAEYHKDLQDPIFPPLPPLPIITEPILSNKVIMMNEYGEIFASKNFSDDDPIWKKYKRMGWAARYVGITKQEFTDRVVCTQTDS